MSMTKLEAIKQQISIYELNDVFAWTLGGWCEDQTYNSPVSQSNKIKMAVFLSRDKVAYSMISATSQIWIAIQPWR